MYVVINYLKGEIESTFTPLVVLVIHVNIHMVGLMFSLSIFHKVHPRYNIWMGCEPLKVLRMCLV